MSGWANDIVFLNIIFNQNCLLIYCVLLLLQDFAASFLYNWLFTIYVIFYWLIPSLSGLWLVHLFLVLFHHPCFLLALHDLSLRGFILCIMVLFAICHIHITNPPPMFCWSCIFFSHLSLCYGLIVCVSVKMSPRCPVAFCNLLSEILFHCYWHFPYVLCVISLPIFISFILYDHPLPSTLLLLTITLCFHGPLSSLCTVTIDPMGKQWFSQRLIVLYVFILLQIQGLMVSIICVVVDGLPIKLGLQALIGLLKWSLAGLGNCAPIGIGLICNKFKMTSLFFSEHLNNTPDKFYTCLLISIALVVVQRSYCLVFVQLPAKLFKTVWDEVYAYIWYSSFQYS